MRCTSHPCHTHRRLPRCPHVAAEPGLPRHRGVTQPGTGPRSRRPPSIQPILCNKRQRLTALRTTQLRISFATSPPAAAPAAPAALARPWNRPRARPQAGPQEPALSLPELRPCQKNDTAKSLLPTAFSLLAARQEAPGWTHKGQGDTAGPRASPAPPAAALAPLHHGKVLSPFLLQQHFQNVSPL